MDLTIIKSASSIYLDQIQYQLALKKYLELNIETSIILNYTQLLKVIYLEYSI